MQQSTGNFSLLFRRLCHRLVTVSGSFVDDVVQDGTPEQKERLQAPFTREFDIKLSGTKTFTYVGLECESKDPSERRISQEKYIGRLQYLKHTASFMEYRSQRARLACQVHTRLDIACTMSLNAQVAAQPHSFECNRSLDSIVTHIKKICGLRLTFPKLHHDTLRLVVYAISSFKNREQSRSQLGSTRR